MEDRVDELDRETWNEVWKGRGRRESAVGKIPAGNGEKIDSTGGKDGIAEWEGAGVDREARAAAVNR